MEMMAAAVPRSSRPTCRPFFSRRFLLPDAPDAGQHRVRDFCSGDRKRIGGSGPQAADTPREKCCRFDGDASGSRIYAYTGNDPVNRVDPSGRGFIFAGIGAGLGFAGGAAESFGQYVAGGAPFSLDNAYEGAALGALAGAIIPDPTTPAELGAFAAAGALSAGASGYVGAGCVLVGLCAGNPPPNPFGPQGPLGPGPDGFFGPNGPLNQLFGPGGLFGPTPPAKPSPSK
jgi:hypothetical protein